MANDKKQRRGKRGQKKKKSDAVEERPGNDETKAEELAEQEEEGVNEESPALVPAPASSVQPFYGLVPTDIRQYAMNVEKMLEEQVFEDSEGLRWRSFLGKSILSISAPWTATDQTNFIGNIFRGFEDNELRLATDYDGSRILEKLLKLSDEFQLRVFMDRLTGRFADLFRHQYASHVCQTLLSVAADAVDKEVNAGWVGHHAQAVLMP